MLKYYVIARTKVFGVDTDEGLKAVNGYFATPVHEFSKNESKVEVFDALFEKYRDEFNKIAAVSYEVICDDEVAS